MPKKAALAAAFFAAALLWMTLRQPEPPPTRASPGETPDAVKPVVRAKPSPRRDGAPPKVHVESAGGNEDDGRGPLVAFDVQDGLAIAFGDIILGVPDEEGLKQGHARLDAPDLWEKPEIPFAIDADVPRQERITEALNHIRRKTGVQFVPYTDQPDALHFQNGREHCWSTFGRQGGLQPIRISPDCGAWEITHEVLHAFGMMHEHSRYDRDQYVEILWDHIDPKYKDQFEVLPKSMLGPLQDTAFDHRSLLLYGPTTFSKDHVKPSIRSRTADAVAPSETGLSPMDVQKVKRLFRLD